MASGGSHSPPNRMPPTQWSMLLELADRDDPQYRDRMAALLKVYWTPMYHYLRAMRQMSDEEAEDVTQDFFTSLLSRGALSKLTPTRGSFRAFLKTSLRNFLFQKIRNQNARPKLESLDPLDHHDAHSLWQEPEDMNAAAVFDKQWSEMVLAKAHERARQELVADGKELYVRVFDDYYKAEGGSTYETLAARHGLKVTDVRNYLTHVRQRGRQALRKVIREYLLPDENVEDEVKFILGQ